MATPKKLASPANSEVTVTAVTAVGTLRNRLDNMTAEEVLALLKENELPVNNAGDILSGGYQWVSGEEREEQIEGKRLLIVTYDSREKDGNTFYTIKAIRQEDGAGFRFNMSGTLIRRDFEKLQEAKLTEMFPATFQRGEPYQVTFEKDGKEVTKVVRSWTYSPI